MRLPSGGGASVADLLLADSPDLAHVARSPLDAGLIQRLDYETSGVLLGAKTRPVWEALFSALIEGAIKKTYVALVEGRCEHAASLGSYIGSPHRGAQKMKVYEKEPARSARALWGETTFMPLSYDSATDTSLVLASASPARRHQIRAHAAHLGHPLVGDTLYGSRHKLESFGVHHRAFFLHAWRVSFTHPVSKHTIEIERPYEDQVPGGGRP